MTSTRTHIARFALPLAAAALVLAACGTPSSGEESTPAAAESAMASEEMSSDEMESEEMASDEAMSEEGEGHSDDGTSEEMAEGEMESEEMAEDEGAMASASGAYVSFADYEKGKDAYDSAGDVVLFFNATWCPTCQEADKNLEGDPDAIPSDLTIVKVDFDNSDELRQKYGVTTQHTFVQIDAKGNEVAKWTGSSTADEIAGQTA